MLNSFGKKQTSPQFFTFYFGRGSIKAFLADFLRTYEKPPTLGVKGIPGARRWVAFPLAASYPHSRCPHLIIFGVTSSEIFPSSNRALIYVIKDLRMRSTAFLDEKNIL